MEQLAVNQESRSIRLAQNADPPTDASAAENRTLAEIHHDLFRFLKEMDDSCVEEGRRVDHGRGGFARIRAIGVGPRRLVIDPLLVKIARGGEGALVLACLVHWTVAHQDAKDGPKIPVYHNGECWFVQTPSDWDREFRIGVRMAGRGIGRLAAAGLVAVIRKRIDEGTVHYLRLKPVALAAAIAKALNLDVPPLHRRES